MTLKATHTVAWVNILFIFTKFNQLSGYAAISFPVTWGYLDCSQQFGVVTKEVTVNTGCTSLCMVTCFFFLGKTWKWIPGSLCCRFLVSLHCGWKIFADFWFRFIVAGESIIWFQFCCHCWVCSRYCPSWYSFPGYEVRLCVPFLWDGTYIPIKTFWLTV